MAAVILYGVCLDCWFIEWELWTKPWKRKRWKYEIVELWSFLAVRSYLNNIYRNILSENQLNTKEKDNDSNATSKE